MASKCISSYLRNVALLALALSTCYTLPIRTVTKSAGKNTPKGNKLILVLLDAFRWDYFKINGLRGFERFMKQGVKAKYMVPDFPTESYPNHYSITTGLHVESHGMIGNYIYDPATNDTFKMGYGQNDSDPKWWNGGEPIWVTGRKYGKKSYMYYWLGCDVEIRGLHPNFCAPYGDGKHSVGTNFHHMIDRGIKNLKEDGGDIIGIYIEDPDHYGHRYGPFSKVLNETIIKIDKHVNYLLDQIQEHNMTDKVNVMIMSDHGQTQMDPNKIINMTNYISKENWDKLLDKYITESTIEYPMYAITPHKGREEQVYQMLRGKNPHMHVYRRDDIPQDWYYKNNKRVRPLLVTDDLGWYMTRTKFRVFDDTGPLQGGHAYGKYEKDMRGIFLATGPDFKANQIDLPPIDIVDLYQMMCHVLKIPAAPNNGSWTRVLPYLRSYYHGGPHGDHFHALMAFILVCLFFLLL